MKIDIGRSCQWLIATAAGPPPLRWPSLICVASCPPLLSTHDRKVSSVSKYRRFSKITRSRASTPSCRQLLPRITRTRTMPRPYLHRRLSRPPSAPAPRRMYDFTSERRDCLELDCGVSSRASSPGYRSRMPMPTAWAAAAGGGRRENEGRTRPR